MKFKLILTASLACAALLPSLSEAKGCLKGAAVGGIGGHVAGHHALIGAAAGCAIGHHMATKKESAAAARTAPTPTQPAVTPASSKL